MPETQPEQETVFLVHAASDGERANPDYFVKLTFELVEEDGQWCGYCTELGTAAFSDTREQARPNFPKQPNCSWSRLKSWGRSRNTWPKTR